MYKISLNNSAGFISIGIILLFIVILGGRVYSYKKGNKNSKKDLFSIVIGGIVGVLVVCAIVVMPMLNGISIQNNMLKVKFMSAFTTREITGEDVLEARVIDLNEETEYKPVNRTFGMGIGNYKEGKFKLANGEFALVYINSDKVLFIELEEEYLIVAPDNFEEFVQDFNENIFTIN